MTTFTDDVTPDPITPVLTRRWLSPRSWDIDVYEQLEGYTALRHARGAGSHGTRRSQVGVRR